MPHSVLFIDGHDIQFHFGQLDLVLLVLAARRRLGLGGGHRLLPGQPDRRRNHLLIRRHLRRTRGRIRRPKHGLRFRRLQPVPFGAVALRSDRQRLGGPIRLQESDHRRLVVGRRRLPALLLLSQPRIALRDVRLDRRFRPQPLLRRGHPHRGLLLRKVPLFRHGNLGLRQRSRHRHLRPVHQVSGERVRRLETRVHNFGRHLVEHVRVRSLVQGLAVDEEKKEENQATIKKKRH